MFCFCSLGGADIWRVLEHPEASAAWDWFGLTRPPRLGWGWGEIDRFGGRCCVVTQGRYGHRARKLTWLYAVIPLYPRLDWRNFKGVRLDAGYNSAEKARAARAAGDCVQRISADERIHTPVPFRDLLISMAASAVDWDRG